MKLENILSTLFAVITVIATAWIFKDNMTEGLLVAILYFEAKKDYREHK